MPLSEHNIIALLSHTHQTIHQYSETTTGELFSGNVPDLIYPPNTEFTPAEEEALALLKGNEALQSALKKIIADNSGEVVFNFLSNIDGVTDPDMEWTGIVLTDRPDAEETQILHDRFFETYWNWKETL